MVWKINEKLRESDKVISDGGCNAEPEFQKLVEFTFAIILSTMLSNNIWINIALLQYIKYLFGSKYSVL